LSCSYKTFELESHLSNHHNLILAEPQHRRDAGRNNLVCSAEELPANHSNKYAQYIVPDNCFNTSCKFKHL